MIGPQWSFCPLQMACSLLDYNPTFLASVAASATVVKPLGMDLMGEFRKDKGWQVALPPLGLAPCGSSDGP